MTIKVTPSTLPQAREELRRFLERYKPLDSAHITPRSLRCLKKAAESENVEDFERYVNAIGFEYGILSQAFGLEFEF